HGYCKRNHRIVMKVVESYAPRIVEWDLINHDHRRPQGTHPRRDYPITDRRGQNHHHQRHASQRVRQAARLPSVSSVVHKEIKAPRNPLTFTTDNERVTIAPAISFAFARLKACRAPKTAGAITALKNTAAPSHEEIRNILSLIKAFSGSVHFNAGRRRQQSD